jgi:hypothetical protein
MNILENTNNLIEEMEFSDDVIWLMELDMSTEDKMEIINEFEIDPGVKEALKNLFIGGGIGSLAGGMVGGPLGAAAGGGIGAVLTAIYRRVKRTNCGPKFTAFIDCLKKSGGTNANSRFNNARPIN